MPSQGGEEEDGKDAAILQELREISNKHSQYNNSSNKRPRLGVAAASTTTSEKDNGKSQSNTFLSSTDENGNLNQYWYSKNTIDTLCNAIREGLSVRGKEGGSVSNNSSRRVAFLSTPSLFFSLSEEERAHCALFDFDKSFNESNFSGGYYFYDYNDPTNIDESCRGAFDMVVIDPPFISQSVWEKYATTARLLMKRDESGDNNSSSSKALVVATTVDENAVLMKALFGCKPTLFRPSIPNLVYQYSVYTNFPSSILANNNLELEGESSTPVKALT